jgi:hypothetical protein
MSRYLRYLMNLCRLQCLYVAMVQVIHLISDFVQMCTRLLSPTLKQYPRKPWFTEKKVENDNVFGL